jgi:hypothetical protein
MKPVGRELYFAFGSNMDLGQMARRLRDPWPIGPAILIDHLRIFRCIPSDGAEAWRRYSRLRDTAFTTNSTHCLPPTLSNRSS